MAVAGGQCGVGHGVWFAVGVADELGQLEAAPTGQGMALWPVEGGARVAVMGWSLVNVKAGRRVSLTMSASSRELALIR